MRLSLENELRLAQLSKTKKEWTRHCLYPGIVVFVFAVAMGHPGYAPLLGILVAGAIYKYPWYRMKRIAGEVERELPLALRSMATLLSIGISFEESLGRCCDRSELQKQLRMSLREVELGKSIPEALDSMAGRVDSKPLRKAVMQLNSLYEKRGDPIVLKKLSNEIVSIQKAQLQEYSGKLVVYSLIFIAVSAILPALFQAYVIVGSTFMSSMISASDAFWIPVAGFPIVDVAVLAFIRFKKPFFA